MTVENKKIVSYFGIAIGLGLVGAMVYYALSNKSVNVDKTVVEIGEDEPEKTPSTTQNNIFTNLPKFNESIEFQFKPLGLSVLK